MSLRSVLLLSLLCLVQLSAALKFDLPALSHNGKNERCIRNFVSRDQLVVVTAIVSGSKGDGQVVNMHIKDSMGNDYGRPKDVVGETRQAFTPSADTAFDVCFENILVTGRHSGNPFRHIELDIDIGADARDWSAIQVQEKLRPVEADLRRIEAMVGEIVMEMDYMRIREQKLRDTNESTNERVKWFAFGTMGMLVGLGAWQVVYLRAYFRIGKEFLPMATPQLFSRVIRSAAARLSSAPVRSLSATAFRASSAVDPNYKPSDAVPGKTERMTGGAQPSGGRKPELGVGEMEGITFKVEPLKRQGEDAATMRARLLYQSRKRGTLESDLLLSTFASQNLPTMSASQLAEFDKFLDENDWDIYYWATQEPEDAATTTNAEAAAAASGEVKDTPTDTWKNGAAKSGEWAQTVGAFKPAYRPVPQRWEESEILARLRQHVRDRSAGGEQGGKGKSGGGLGQMPEIHPFES
ncbi:vesicle coat component [Onygenales sp. PD_10]|nr:vesicle coat component [Onygenales sp. PD_10]